MPRGNGSNVPPERVALVALGPSSLGYLMMAEQVGNKRRRYDEVWVINTYASVLKADLIFHMDDMRIQEIRAKADPNGKVAGMLQSFKELDTPIMTSRAYKDYPTSIEYPLEEILNTFPYGYFTTTPPYALAYAQYLGVKELSLFGLDYDWPGARAVEGGKSCCEFWCGMLLASGMDVQMCLGSTLLGAQMRGPDRFYGYDTREVHATKGEDGRVTVEYKEVKDLPSAEAVEKKYSAITTEEVEQGLL